MIDILENLVIAGKEKATPKEVAEKKTQKNYTYKRIEKQQTGIGRPTKSTRILEHLKRHEGITSMEAIRLYDVTRLAAIIHGFRKRGYSIITEDIKAIDRYGSPVRYARYHLLKQ